MLGLGRALGETVAVLIILRSAANASTWSLFDGGVTPSPRRSPLQRQSSVLPFRPARTSPAGFVLFALTFVVNALARMVAKGKVNG